MIKVEFKNDICEVQLNRPEIHNAFHPVMIKELSDCFQSLSSREDIKAVVLSGNGKSFSAGADLNWMKEMREATFEENEADAKNLFGMFDAIARCSVPVIGKAHGNVYGGGIGLLAACDIVLLEEKTNLCFSEVKWGLSPATISPFILRKVGMGKAREWMLTAKVFSAKEALSAGLAQFIGTQEEVEAYLEQTLFQFKENAPLAVRECKKLFFAYEELNWQGIKDFTTKQIAERRVSEEGQEGLEFFISKKVPSWKVRK